MSVIEPGTTQMNSDERRSLTHGEFWIPESERQVYHEALEALNAAGIPYVISGLYAIHAYTGIYRETKDLDLLLEPSAVVPAAEALKGAGFQVRLEDPHWLAKALKGAMVDLIFGMANGIAFIDRAWHEHARPAILAATPVRIAPPEELIWHRLFIGERHRFDMADVVHLILCRGHELEWERLLHRVGENWRLLALQLHFFDFVYPGHRHQIPASVRRSLRERAGRADDEADEEAAALAGEGVLDGRAPEPGPPLCRGPMLSRFSFSIDVNEWGFQDERARHVADRRAMPVVTEIRNAEVWDD